MRDSGIDIVQGCYHAESLDPILVFLRIPHAELSVSGHVIVVTPRVLD